MQGLKTLNFHIPFLRKLLVLVLYEMRLKPRKKPRKRRMWKTGDPACVREMVEIPGAW